MTFFNRKVGLAVSDPPDGLKFRIIKTTDGGRTWNVVDPAGMPPRAAGRVRLRSQRAVPDEQPRPLRLVRKRRRLHVSSHPATEAEPGP